MGNENTDLLPPTPEGLRALKWQRAIGHFLFLPFGTLLVVLMWWRGYRLENIREIRRQFRELTREKKPLLICSNHLTFIDSALIIWAFGSVPAHILRFRAFPWNLPAGDFFKRKLHFRIVAFLTKCIFIHRDGSKDHKNGVLGACRYLLGKGESVMLFPEGRRSRLGIFDRSHITFGVGKLLSTLPGCRVLCVYMRGDKQIGFTDYPPRDCRFQLLSRVIVPHSLQTGRELYFDLASQIADNIQDLEHAYFAKSGEIPVPAVERQPTALITGASSGIGRALAHRFAKDGHNLVVVARDEKRLQDLAKDCEKHYGTRVTVIPTDLSSDTGVSTLLDSLELQRIKIDALVNNAGFTVHGPFAETDLHHERRLINAQIDAVLRITKHCLPHMRRKGTGQILNVASVYAYSPVPFQSVYAACKAFLLSFSESLANEVEGDGIQVTVLCPGVTQTEFRSRAGMREKPNSGLTAEIVARMGYQGLKRGRRIVIPSYVNRHFVGVVRHLPGHSAAGLLNLINRKRGVNPV